MEKSYKRITAAHPMHELMQYMHSMGHTVCDAVDHNDESGCSNPDCWKYVKK